MARARRSSEEVQKLAEQAKVLVDGGMSVLAASKQAGISHSVYNRLIEGKVFKGKRRRAKVGKVQRRTVEETKLAVARALARVNRGEDRVAVLKELHLGENTYYKYKKAAGNTGSIDVRSLPPRPKKGNAHGGARKGKPVNMNDVASVATRISRLDRKIAEANALSDERKELATQLLRLLKA